MLSVLSSFGGHLRLRHASIGALRFGASGCGCGGRVTPTGKDQPRFGQLDLVRQCFVAFSRPGLAAQRADLAIKLAHQVFEPRQIGLGRAQFLFGVLAPHMQPGDPGGFFEHHPPFGWFGRDHGGDPALTD